MWIYKAHNVNTQAESEAMFNVNVTIAVHALNIKRFVLFYIHIRPTCGVE